MATSRIKVKRVCEWCGKEFYAQKLSTRYCSSRCNSNAYKAKKRAANVKEAERELSIKPTSEIKEKEYLSVEQCAILLGLTRMSVYNLIYRGQLKATRLSSRLTRIRKADVEGMLTSGGYKKWSGVALTLEDSSKEMVAEPANAVTTNAESIKDATTEGSTNQSRKNATKSEITEFYTTKEILDKFGISNAWLFKMTKQHPVPKVIRMGKSYWSRRHIDALMKKKELDATITEWYTTEEMMQKFGMSTSAVYSFISENKIPKKRVKSQAYYSKRHVDIAKGLIEPPTVEYYSIKEAMEKFQMTRDQIYHYAKRFNIPKQMEGKYVKYSKNEMDAAFAGPVICLSPFSPR